MLPLQDLDNLIQKPRFVSYALRRHSYPFKHSQSLAYSNFVDALTTIVHTKALYII